MRKALLRESGYILLVALCLTLGIITAFRVGEAHNGKAIRVDEFRPPVSALIDVNSAEADILVSLPGIGEKLAQRIIDGRPYSSLEDLKRVEGIGDKILEGIADRIRIGGAD